MRQRSSAGLTIFLALCSLPSADAAPQEMASFRKLFRRPGELSTAVGSDNIRDCAPSVRRAVKHAREKWGVFHFACINGVIRNIFVHPDSRINQAPGTFITENLGLFDLKGAPIIVKFDGDAGTEFFKDRIVAGTLIYRVEREGPLVEQPQSVQPISTRDLQTAPGAVQGKHIAFELGLIDPEDDSLEAHPGIKGVP